MLKGVKCIVCIGDSITEAADTGGGYVQALRAKVEPRGIKVVNAGIGGHRSIEMRERFGADVLSHRPELVTISAGVNDVWRFYDSPDGGVPVDKYFRMMDDMVEMAKTQQAKVVILCPTMVGEDFDAEPNKKLLEYRAAAAEVARFHHLTFVDLYSTFKWVLKTFHTAAGKEFNLLTTDGVHMLPAGNAIMAKQVLLALGLVE